MEDFLTEATEENIAGKILWYNQQLAEVKNDFIRWLEELGYTVEVHEKTVRITEGLSGTYDSIEYLFTVHGKGHEDIDIRIAPQGIWWLGTQGMIYLYGKFGRELIGYFREDGLFSRDHTDLNYGNVMEDAWYWDDQGINTQVQKLSRDTVATLLERVS
jgi:hypothetical protein